MSVRSFVMSLDVPKNKQQQACLALMNFVMYLTHWSLQLLVDQQLHLKGDSTGSVFALGDCSCVEENPMPPTAQVSCL